MGDAFRGAMGPQGVQSLVKSLAGQFSGQVSSLQRTPEHNARVGGVANSQHISGTAGDVVIPDPAARRQFMDAVRAKGLEAIDEGDHVHVELPPRGRQVAQAGGLNFRKPDAPKAPSELERKLELARQMGATPDQLRNMVLGDSGGGKVTATMQRQANTAKAKLIDLNAIRAQLARVKQTFGPLQGTLSATPYVGKFIPSEEGKRFDATVSMLQGMVRKLTRTPGEGAMSDYETKLAQLANPSRSEYESVTADQIAQLEELVQTMTQGYEALLQDNGGNSANIQKQAAPSGGSDIDSILDKYR